jgi:alanyl-tRNA synthetase
LTERLYQTDTYATMFESRVVSVAENGRHYATVLESTLFYPEAGGQPADTGSLAGLRIESTLEEGGSILHLSSERPPFKAGDIVAGKIDWARRFLNMQQHTGQHILSQAFLRVLGAKTVSSKLGIEHSTIDISALDLAWDDMEKTERMANSVIFENRPVAIHEAGAGETADLRLKKPVEREVLRVVEVEGFDKSPCGGTHCRMTGEVGLVKILRWEKIRETTRVEFLCGVLAEADYFWKSRFIVDLARDLTTKDTNVPRQIQEVLESHKDLRKQVGELRHRLLAYDAADLAAGAREISGVRVISTCLEGRSPSEVRELAARLTAEERTIALIASGGARAHFVFSRSHDLSIDMRRVIKVACEVVEGKGGGRPEVCEGGGKRGDRAGQALEQAFRVLTDLLAEQST